MFDPFNPLVGIKPRFTEEQLEDISTWFVSKAKPNLLLDEVPTYAVSIEHFRDYLSLKKFHRRNFHYPSYFEIMATAEMLRAGVTRLLTQDQAIFMLNSWVLEPEIKHELLLAFKLFDTENRNFLEVADIITIVTGFDGFDEAETIEILRDADVKSDTRIFYENFIESMFSIAPELYNEKVHTYLYEDPDEDPSVEPEPEPVIEEPPPSPPPPPPPPPPSKKDNKKKKK